MVIKSHVEKIMKHWVAFSEVNRPQEVWKIPNTGLNTEETFSLRCDAPTPPRRLRGFENKINGTLSCYICEEGD